MKFDRNQKKNKRSGTAPNIRICNVCINHPVRLWMPVFLLEVITETRGTKMQAKQSLFKAIGGSAVALVLLAYGASAQAQAFTETFGNAAGRVSNAYVPNFGFAASGAVTDGNYTVMPPQGIVASTGDAYWTNLPDDHTGGGALMVLNAGPALNEFYVRDFNTLPGHTYRISAWRYVVNGNGGTGATAPISWSLQVRDPSNDAIRVESGAIPSTPTQAWIESTYEFTVPANCAAARTPVPARLALTNQSPVTSGNDFYIDDISVTDITPHDVCPATPVPALDTAGLGLLGLLSAGMGALALRRRKRAK
ncbi:hypothetical protein [Ottowia sp.]|uniref:hypothetical protein n=1 Tax=Ottowia sp. TaxID=1898956 RepID=UPI0025D87163|nr:hypothetical protein [Ottowia sp.]MBK6614061.1 hypothetical protein [Ottowia sp.]